MLWIGVWLVFFTDPVHDLLHQPRATGTAVWAWTGTAAFLVGYLMLVFRYTARPLAGAAGRLTLVGLFVLAVLLVGTLGESWLVLFVYVCVSIGATMPIGPANVLIPAAAAVMAGLALVVRANPGFGLIGSALLAGFAMTGVRRLVRTTVELRQARATVAQLAANEERLRLARDLHDLLGHSLSLITLKSELAGRMLPARVDDARQQVAEIEQVSRQALVDVREAVSGYRRPSLAGELAGAKSALGAAGIAADLPAQPPSRDLAPEREGVLAWVLREAVTNVVRHSGARRCTVTFAVRQTLDGPFLELRVADDGEGPSGAYYGNGLTGITERLTAAGGALETGSVFTARGRRGTGFLLTARVPLGSAP
ncbi:sensor histidine kinase [Streptomyces tsukubensis]|nr:sensor histidine kinase [Streptomyces tsukubensis]QFR97995.1 sensor histidine kinase [Streptomyces tsukubensis]